MNNNNRTFRLLRLPYFILATKDSGGASLYDKPSLPCFRLGCVFFLVTPTASSIFPYNGQNSHNPAQIRKEGTEMEALHGRKRDLLQSPNSL
nr:uncharacterized protein LOC105466626 isoform X2 [Macaca nemestrina]